MFVVLGGLGLLAALLLPSRNSETSQLPESLPSATATTAVTLPADSGGESGGGSGNESGGGESPVTVPGGEPVPEGVTEVLATGGSTAFSFAVPESLKGSRVKAAVPAATATPSADESQLLVTVRCSLVKNETLAQVAISEGDSVVTVLPVVLIPERGEPCVAGSVLKSVSLPLASPLGDRQIFVAPAGTAVPTPN